MLDVTIGKKKVKIPIKWEEVTFNQFLATLKAQGDLGSILPIFLGVPRETLLKSKIKGLESIINTLQFLKTDLILLEKPKKIGKYNLPEDITFETVEQFELLNKEIEKSNLSEDLTEKTAFLANYCALYCQAINEPFDYSKSLEVAEQLKNESCIEILSAGRFFLAKARHLETGLSMNYLLSLTQTKNGKPVSIPSTKRSDSTPRSTKSPVTSTRMMKPLPNGRSKGFTRK